MSLGLGSPTSLVDTQMTESPLTGERQYSMKVDMAGHPPEEVYDIVGAQMVAMLEHVVAMGWKVKGAPVVVEEYNFLKDCSTLIATVTLVEGELW